MALRSGQWLHEGNGHLLSRAQSAGVSNLNIPKEQIKELGNYKIVANTRDIPDLSFDVESFDVNTDYEATLLDLDPAAITSGQALNLDDAKPYDITTPIKNSQGIYSVVKGVIVPYLNLEQSVYRFGVRANATETHTLRGDSIYYIPGAPYYQEFAASGTGPYTLAQTALAYTENGNTFHVVGLCYVRSDGTYKRLYYGIDYTDTTTNFTLNVAAPAGSVLKALYGSTTARTMPQSIHPSTIVKPAAVRSRNIDFYLGTNVATPVYSRWDGVQTVEITRRVTIENDEEFGNTKYVGQDWDVPAVSGTVGIKPADLPALFDKIATIAGVSTSVIAGPNTHVQLPLEVRVSHPDTGAVLKTWAIPDAVFTIPAYQPRVGQKTEFSLPWESETGSMLIYKGLP